MAAAGRAQAARDRVPRIDPYGFERPEDFDYAAYEEFFSTYLVILTRRAIKWSKLLKGGGGVQRSMTVKRYIRKGVPLEHRARVWMGVSGAQAQMDRNPGYYQRLLQGERSASLEEAIRTGSLCPLYARSPPALAPPSAPCLCESDSPRLHVGGIRQCLSFCIWLVSRSTVSERSTRAVCASGLPPPGYSEFWLNKVSSNSPRPAVGALGTDPEVESLGHTAALVCCQGACLSRGAGSEEQAHLASAQAGRSPHLPPVQGPGRKISKPAKASHRTGRHTGVSTVDMSRTFPDNVRFRKDAEPCLQGPLYNVLLAYGHHNHGVGYCQGMNFIAGYLILVTKSEEEAFWLLDALVGRILPADYYSPSMLGLKTDQEVLGELVRLKLPAVAALMDGHGVLWTLVASRWFICLFVDVLPVETVLRVWDCLFSEGSKILFRVALTLLKHHQASILEATSIPDLCEKFKEITRGHFVTECHSFMQRIFSEPGSLSRASIARLRERCRARLLAQG